MVFYTFLNEQFVVVVGCIFLYIFFSAARNSKQNLISYSEITMDNKKKIVEKLKSMI